VIGSRLDVEVGGSEVVSDSLGVVDDPERELLLCGGPMLANDCKVDISSGSGDSVIRGDKIGPSGSVDSRGGRPDFWGFPAPEEADLPLLEAIPEAFLLCSACL
jgi:hypothetical protein